MSAIHGRLASDKATTTLPSNFVSASAGLCNTMGLLSDTYDCMLRMRWECRERFLRYRLQREPLVRNPGLHHGTCVTHVPWCMSGSLTRSRRSRLMFGMIQTCNIDMHLHSIPFHFISSPHSEKAQRVGNIIRGSQRPPHPHPHPTPIVHGEYHYCS